MAIPVLATVGSVQAVGGTGSFLDAFDAFFTLASAATNVRVISSVGGAGAREAIVLAPPAGSPVENMRVLVCGKSAGSPLMQTPDTFLANAFHVGLAKGLSDTPVYTNAWDTAANPFDTAQYMQLSRCSAAATDFAEVILLEDEETITVLFRTVAGSFYGFVIGPRFAPGSANACETNERLYGLLTSGSNTIATTLLSSTSAAGPFTQHSTSSGDAHAYIFEPATATVTSVQRTTFHRSDMLPTDSMGNEEYEPLFYRRVTAKTRVGRLREVFVTKGQWQTKVQSGGIDVGYVFGPSTTTDVEALLFKA